MLDKAFDALKTYDWGSDRKLLKPIDDAIVATQGDAAARKILENRLLDVLKSDVSRDVKDFVCRALRTIGTADSVPTLAALLPDAELSHMARYALARIPAPEATKALRDALPNVSNELKVGIMSTLGMRKDVACIGLLAKLLNDSDAAVSRSAALALGAIRGPEAAKVLAGVKTTDSAAKLAATDASLACAEDLLNDGKKSDALAVYKRIAAAKPPKHIQLAATRGILACAGK